jgi:hypothetical protein
VPQARRIAANSYAWRTKYAGMQVSDAKRLRELEEQNRRLKKLVAEQALDISPLREVNRKIGRACRASARGRVVDDRASTDPASGLQAGELAAPDVGLRFKRAEPEGLRQAMQDVVYAFPRLDYRVCWARRFMQLPLYQTSYKAYFD